MIPQIWHKTLPVLIELSDEDICDDIAPLPLFLSLKWNAYLGFYIAQIQQYFHMYAPFPIDKEQFHLELFDGTVLQEEIIVYHLVQLFQIKLDEPLKMKFCFRAREKVQKIDLGRHFKNSLKASTSLKNGKYGAARLTVEMSISNVENMCDAFRNNDFQRFLGSEDFNSDNLGYIFLINKAENIAVKFLCGNQVIQRYSAKNISLSQFTESVFGAEFSKKLKFKIHMVPITDLSIIMSSLQKYSHPDGYLYIHI